MADLEWDEKKAHENLQKHGVDFADTPPVFEDELAITLPDETVDEEERFVTLGTDALGRILVVLYTWREEARIRIISARKATRRERRQYEGKRK